VREVHARWIQLDMSRPGAWGWVSFGPDGTPREAGEVRFLTGSDYSGDLVPLTERTTAGKVRRAVATQAGCRPSRVVIRTDVVPMAESGQRVVVARFSTCPGCGYPLQAGESERCAVCAEVAE